VIEPRSAGPISGSRFAFPTESNLRGSEYCDQTARALPQARQASTHVWVNPSAIQRALGVVLLRMIGRSWHADASSCHTFIVVTAGCSAGCRRQASKERPVRAWHGRICQHDP